MNKISFLSLYIINQVRFRRLILGLSTRGLSVALKNSEGYVGMVESSSSKTQYPTHEWPKLAEVLKCTVHDLLPPGDLSDKSAGRLVDKTVIDLADENDMTFVINGLIDADYFKTPQSLASVVEHLNIKSRRQSELLGLLLRASGALKVDGDKYYR